MKKLLVSCAFTVILLISASQVFDAKAEYDKDVGTCCPETNSICFVGTHIFMGYYYSLGPCW